MHGTVISLVEAGEIAAGHRVAVDDLEFAATWLEQYEGEPEDDAQNLYSAATVAAWLRREVNRREAKRKA